MQGLDGAFLDFGEKVVSKNTDLQEKSGTLLVLILDSAIVDRATEFLCLRFQAYSKHSFMKTRASSFVDLRSISNQREFNPLTTAQLITQQ